MKKVKVIELSSKELDYFFAKCIGYVFTYFNYEDNAGSVSGISSSWNDVGGVIEKHDIHLESNLAYGNKKEWNAQIPNYNNAQWFRCQGKTALEAACRVFVYSKLGEFVQVPE